MRFGLTTFIFACCLIGMDAMNPGGNGGNIARGNDGAIREEGGPAEFAGNGGAGRGGLSPSGIVFVRLLITFCSLFAIMLISGSKAALDVDAIKSVQGFPTFEEKLVLAKPSVIDLNQSPSYSIETVTEITKLEEMVASETLTVLKQLDESTGDEILACVNTIDVDSFQSDMLKEVKSLRKRFLVGRDEAYDEIADAASSISEVLLRLLWHTARESPKVALETMHLFFQLAKISSQGALQVMFFTVQVAKVSMSASTDFIIFMTQFAKMNAPQALEFMKLMSEVAKKSIDLVKNFMILISAVSKISCDKALKIAILLRDMQERGMPQWLEFVSFICFYSTQSFQNAKELMLLLADKAAISHEEAFRLIEWISEYSKPYIANATWLAQRFLRDAVRAQN